MVREAAEHSALQHFARLKEIVAGVRAVARDRVRAALRVNDDALRGLLGGFRILDLA